MIRVSLEFATQDELVAFFSKPQIIPNPPVITESMTASEAATALNAAAPETAAPKRGRPKKEDKVPATPPAGPAEAAPAPKADAPSAAPVAASAEASTAKAPDMDAVRALAQKVIEKLGNELGMDAARKVLTERAGVKVLRDIPTDKFGGVLEGLKALLEGK